MRARFSIIRFTPIRRPCWQRYPISRWAEWSASPWRATCQARSIPLLAAPSTRAALSRQIAASEKSPSRAWSTGALSHVTTRPNIVSAYRRTIASPFLRLAGLRTILSSNFYRSIGNLSEYRQTN
ncbi:hypothetical protein CHELA1G11_10579 [Hyphomicrobiales bacterium]|nr:hypothetical protein CHELA1G11_10579 [Hyphomicrobiales bacterium]CAH1673690.1 hypothetical protein CHELA1G2_13725 [Hyphomicrobiales bacterium]